MQLHHLEIISYFVGAQLGSHVGEVKVHIVVALSYTCLTWGGYFSGVDHVLDCSLIETSKVNN